MISHIGHMTLLVKDQKAARDFYVDKLGFVVLEEHKDDKGGWTWLIVAPTKKSQTVLTLMLPTNKDEEKVVGKQTGKIPFLILVTNDCKKDAAELKKRGVKFLKDATDEFWGVDALFEDLYGNVIDLCEPK